MLKPSRISAPLRPDAANSQKPEHKIQRLAAGHTAAGAATEEKPMQAQEAAKDVTACFRLDAPLWQAAKRIAREERMSTATYVRRLIAKDAETRGQKLEAA